MPKLAVRYGGGLAAHCRCTANYLNILQAPGPGFRAHPAAPLTKVSFVPIGASLFRPSTMAMPCPVYRTCMGMEALKASFMCFIESIDQMIAFPDVCRQRPRPTDLQFDQWVIGSAYYKRKLTLPTSTSASIFLMVSIWFGLFTRFRNRLISSSQLGSACVLNRFDPSGLDTLALLGLLCCTLMQIGI